MKELSYFSARPRFAEAHPYDIGMPLFWWKGHYDIHFLDTLYRIDEDEFADFCAYHLDHFKKANDGAEESAFFRHLRDIVRDELKNLIADDKRNLKDRHSRIVRHKLHLRSFLAYLDTVDVWKADRTKDEIIAAKERHSSQWKHCGQSNTAYRPHRKWNG